MPIGVKCVSVPQAELRQLASDQLECPPTATAYGLCTSTTK